jgi:hypothetical protein
MKTLAITILAILAILLFIIYRINMVSSDMTNDAVKKSIGTYQIDLDNSLINDYVKDSLLIKSLSLNLNADMTFIFSKSVQFIYDSSGTWEFIEDGIYSINRLNYKNSNGFNNQISQCCYDTDKIQMKLPISKNNNKQVDLIVFKKIK